MLHHYLRPLLTPSSVALIGASDRPDSLGRIVFENILADQFHGEMFPVNPSHRKVLGQKSWRSVAAIGKMVDLAIIAAPPSATHDIIAALPKGRLHAAILLTDPPAGDINAARRWTREVATLAQRRGVRLVGPGAFGLIRTDIGLNASFSDVPVLPGRLALIAQSGAVCTAMLDFAAPMGIGFSSVISLGAGIDINFGELLDALLLDNGTDGILLYVETVRDARRFLSALRAAARTKPVIVLKAGRSHDRTLPEGSHAPPPDAVFDAAVRRAGTVRVKTYTQLFAAARILSMGKVAKGDRLAIVANGRGPALLAADSAAERGVTLAEFEPQTVKALDAVLPPESARANPVDVRGDAPPERFAAAVAAVLSDKNVDAVLALHVPRPATGPTDAARAVAAVTRGLSKPVLGAWLGALDRPEAREALEAGGIANFFTPENAVEAFSFLAAYRRHQEWLLEVPPPQPEPEPPQIATAEAVREQAETDGRTLLTESQAARLLSSFGIEVLASRTAFTLDEAQTFARELGYPVSLRLDVATLPARSPLSIRRENLRDGRALARAFRDLAQAAHDRYRNEVKVGFLVTKQPPPGVGRELSVGVYTDPVFGPVIAFGAGTRQPLPPGERALMLPPLNRRLASDLIAGAHRWVSAGDPEHEPLVRLLLQVSTLVCALPWVRELELDPVLLEPDRAEVAGMRVVLDHRRRSLTGYRHMAIHPYPSELSEDVKSRDGTPVHIRAIQPEDAELERRFIDALSEQTRYFRFFYRLTSLTPAMLARFTQVDYDRELALVAIVADPQGPGRQSFIGVARYIGNPDQESAEFAVVVADAWQNRGIARLLMERLIGCARRKGLKRLEGSVLRTNTNMIKFVTALGFEIHDDPTDTEQVLAIFKLA
jgi:acetyltransferase